jgi:hypothetical protein
MGSALELGKVVSVAWLSRNWLDCPKAIKTYLVCAIVTLMLITSMGSFGFMSKAHLAQTENVSQSSLVLNQVELEIQEQERIRQNAQTSLNNLDRVASMADTNNYSKVAKNQTAQRRQVAEDIRNADTQISNLNIRALPLRQQTQKLEAEVGPLKYIAELIYGQSAKDHFDAAVRLIIIMIVLVFDPLAMVLLVAANYSLKPKSRIRYDKLTGKLVTT